MTAASTHLVIADDHPLFRDALRQAVGSVVTSAKIDEAGSFEDLTALLEKDSDVDLIMLDLSMPGISGFSGLIYLRAQYPAIPVVIVSARDDGGPNSRSLDFGAAGFIPKRARGDSLRPRGGGGLPLGGIVVTARGRRDGAHPGYLRGRALDCFASLGMTIDPPP